METAEPSSATLARSILALIAAAVLTATGCAKQDESYTAEPPPTDEQMRLEETLRNLPWGNIAFNAPETMKLGERHTIELILSLQKSVDELSTQVKEEGVVESDSIKVSNRMLANLTGFGFEIKAVESEEQAIRAQEDTRWRWDVMPTAEGAQDLHLTLTALVEVDGQDSRIAIRTFDKTITVRVTAMQRATMFVTANWQWLWAAILIPIFGIVMQWWKKSRKRTREME